MYESYIQEPVNKSDIPVQPCVAYEISTQPYEIPTQPYEIPTQPSVAYSPGQARRNSPEEDEKGYVVVDPPAGFVNQWTNLLNQKTMCL